ncbi:peptidylprolyl isomerase [Vibrio gallicus]|uniref:peptidylprolyl isomerase n=1 Tax=Vibrio gallicus TaxID=190897 RepID=UPI0021C2A667|nr:peptidylprolyl isomerase [Vibrio gallicus]
MMERLREGVNSIAVKIILGLIILSFVFTGVSGYLGGGSSVAAKVGDSEISRQDFEMAYQNERNRMQQQAGDSFSAQLGDPAFVQSFRKEVLDRMVNQMLLEQYASDLGMRVSDEQVRSMILTMPQFQSNGKFDQQVYQAFLRRAGFNADSFAAYLRSDLVRQQVIQALDNSDFVLPQEVAQTAQLITQKRDIRTITLSPSEMAKSIKLTDEQLNKFYKDNSQRFTRPQQYKVSYLELSAQSLKSSENVSDQKAQEYYQHNLDKYSTTEQRSLSHILVKDQAKAEQLLAKLNSGADFATLAKESSEDAGSADNGGSLGWVEKGTMDPEFEKAAFALENKGDISAVVKSNFGYHIIQLSGIKAAQAKPYADVAADIKKEVAEQEAVNSFYELQNKLESVAFEYPDSLDDAAKAIDQEIHTTGFISQADAPEILKSDKVMQALQTPEVSEDGLNSDVIEIAPEHVVVVRIEDSRPQTVLPYADVATQVKQQLSEVEGRNKANALADKVTKALESGDDSVLATEQLKFSAVQSIDRSSAYARTVFAMPRPTQDKPHFAKSMDYTGNVVIIELNKVTNNIDPKFNAQIESQLKRAQSEQELMALITALRSKIDVEYYVVGDGQ